MTENLTPLMFSILNRVDTPSSRSTYPEIATQVKNRLRRYSLISIINAALTIIRLNQGKGSYQELQSYPWLTFLIIKLALEDSAVSLTQGQTCTVQELIDLRGLLWNIPAPIEITTPPEIGIYRRMRAILHSQLMFQVSETRSFMRISALIARLNVSHPSHIQFRTVMGINPDNFVALAWGVFAATLNGDNSFTIQWFESVRDLYQNDIEIFLNKFSRTPNELRALLRQELQTRIKNGRVAEARQNTEIIEFPWLAKFPFLRTPTDSFVIWHPLVFARGMEQASHNALSTLGQAYTDEFSKVFESYVLELIDEANLNYVDETSIRQGRRNNPAVEAIIRHDAANIMVEAKMGLFPEEALITYIGHRLHYRTQRVREAIAQGWKVSSLIREANSIFANQLNKPEDFLIVVTSSPFNICSGEQLRRYLGNDLMTHFTATFPSPSQDQLDRLPLKNIFIVSIDEFEYLMGATRDSVIDLLEFLKESASLSLDARTSTFTFEQFLRAKVSTKPATTLLDQAEARTLEPIEQHLGNQNV